MTRERISGLPDDDWRKKHADFNEPALSANLALVERLRTIGGRYDSSPGAVAVAWTLHNPAVTGAIVGARKPEQVNDMVAAAEIRLTGAEINEAESATKLAA
jgi:aryl-alcohol dehydrogenase-like predicted oxidoreductase